ncbi:MAG: hypothetical protein JXB10_03365 [Pirellulales bacterium]|nr:hypothetical protein [Pirellulales bacterium]
MYDPSKNRGGMVGAGIVMLLTFIPLVPSLYDHKISIPLSAVLLISFILSAVLASLGYVSGRSGAKCRGVYRAILSGAALFTVACVVVFTTYLLLGMNIETSRRFWFLAVQWTVIFAVSGGLVSGLGAVIARDYRRFHRLRPAPQFTLQELFVFSFLVSVIISAISSRMFFKELVG